MRAVIISGGAVSDYDYIKAQIRPGDVIICADSGYNHAVEMGIRPSIVLGDFDSAGYVPDDVPCLSYPSRKDLTDSELAIEYAWEQGFRDFLLLAATGKRLDHGLTNILMLKTIMERGGTAVIIDEFNKIMITDSMMEIDEPPGSILSLIPLTNCKGVTTRSLEYPLHEADMSVGKGLGVSNIVTGAAPAVNLRDGLMIVIAARE